MVKKIAIALMLVLSVLLIVSCDPDAYKKSNDITLVYDSTKIEVKDSSSASANTIASGSVIKAGDTIYLYVKDLDENVSRVVSWSLSGKAIDGSGSNGYMVFSLSKSNCELKDKKYVCTVTVELRDAYKATLTYDDTKFKCYDGVKSATKTPTEKASPVTLKEDETVYLYPQLDSESKRVSTITVNGVDKASDKTFYDPVADNSIIIEAGEDYNGTIEIDAGEWRTIQPAVVKFADDIKVKRTSFYDTYVAMTSTGDVEIDSGSCVFEDDLLYFSLADGSSKSVVWKVNGKETSLTKGLLVTADMASTNLVITYTVVD